MYWYWKAKVTIIQELPERLPICDFCGMHMSVARMIKHINTSRCNKVTEIRIKRRGVEMAERCREMDFILYGREGGALVEEVSNFKYLGRPLDQTDY